MCMPKPNSIRAETSPRHRASERSTRVGPAAGSASIRSASQSWLPRFYLSRTDNHSLLDKPHAGGSDNNRLLQPPAIFRSTNYSMPYQPHTFRSDNHPLAAHPQSIRSNNTSLPSKPSSIGTNNRLLLDKTAPISLKNPCFPQKSTFSPLVDHSPALQGGVNSPAPPHSAGPTAPWNPPPVPFFPSALGRWPNCPPHADAPHPLPPVPTTPSKN